MAHPRVVPPSGSSRREKGKVRLTNLIYEKANRGIVATAGSAQSQLALRAWQGPKGASSLGSFKKKGGVRISAPPAIYGDIIYIMLRGNWAVYFEVFDSAPPHLARSVLVVFCRRCRLGQANHVLATV